MVHLFHACYTVVWGQKGLPILQASLRRGKKTTGYCRLPEGLPDGKDALSPAIVM
jgi:hypothetical protein